MSRRRYAPTYTPIDIQNPTQPTHLIRLHPPVDAGRQPVHVSLVELGVLPQVVVPIEVGQGGGDGAQGGGAGGAEGLHYIFLLLLWKGLG